jgi:phosphoribosylformylglycinamidine cyclo-ligase
VGTIVGSVARDKVLDGSRVKPGQVLLGLESAGLHTNGYSLARKILFERLELGLEDRPEELGGRTVCEALLAEHRSYFSPLWPLLEEGRIAAMAHITGGGLPGNLPRILGGTDALLERGSWEIPGLFQLLQSAGQLADEEAYRAFNMGIGMVLFVDQEEEAAVRAHLDSIGEPVHGIGTLEAGSGAVRWK